MSALFPLTQFLEALADVFAPALLRPATMLAIRGMQFCEGQCCAEPTSYVHESPTLRTIEPFTLMAWRDLGSEQHHVGYFELGREDLAGLAQETGVRSDPRP